MIHARASLGSARARAEKYCTCSHSKDIHGAMYDGDHCEIVTHPCRGLVVDREGNWEKCDCEEYEEFQSVITGLEEA